jgi:ABC-type antimicrobial peptide transport system permease subunit
MIAVWFQTLAIIATVLALVGLYALTAHGVSQRMHEIGVRMALGARSGQVVWLFVRRTLLQLAIGLTFGIAGALAAVRFVAAFLGDTSPSDPLVLAGVSVALGAVAVAATAWPARKAARINPSIALRTE